MMMCCTESGRRARRASSITAATAACVLHGLAASAVAQHSFGDPAVVLATGDPAPGGLTVTFIGGGTINNAGEIGLWGSAETGQLLDPPTIAVWRLNGGVLSEVARVGQPAPAVANGDLDSFSFPPNITDDGTLVFDAGLRGSGVTVTSQFAKFRSLAGGGLQLIARDGDPAPDAGADFVGVSSLTTPSTPDGRALVGAPLTDNTIGAWLYDGPAADTLALFGGTINTSGLAGTITSFTGGGVGSSVVNAAGRIPLFVSVLTPSFSFVSAVVTADGGGAFTLIASENTPIPGLPPNALDNPGFGSASINSMGTVAFSFGGFSGFGGVVASEAGVLRTVAVQGQSAPGGGTFGDFALSDVWLNNAGDVAFSTGLAQGSGGVDADSDSGIWVDRAGVLTQLLREGDVAPGCPPAVFGASAPFADIILNPMLVSNASGRFVYLGQLAGPGVSVLNDNAIWATDAAGQLALVVREGDTLDRGGSLGPGVVAGLAFVGADANFGSTIGGDRASGGADGRPRALNDQDELLVYVLFEDQAEALVLYDLAGGVASPCVGDATGDGVVDVIDLNRVLAAFNQPADVDPPADFNADGFIDVIDLNGVLGAFNTACL
jgi:hypothetical protein